MRATPPADRGDPAVECEARAGPVAPSGKEIGRIRPAGGGKAGQRGGEQVTREREIKVLKGLKGENEKWAAATRELLRQNNVTMINLIGGPGCGKTALLCRLVEYLGGSSRVAVLEGDVETTYDARRIAETGIPVRQLLTGGACHLEARLVHAG
ncbi:MAG TPA: hypothetical protein ENG36_01080, partial [Lentisphaerae bacterium]|nr:hypothetical protein [Lentisphaerota bacterium]